MKIGDSAFNSKMIIFSCLSVILLTVKTEGFSTTQQGETDHFCTFEESDPSCFLEQDKTDDFDWQKAVEVTEVKVDTILHVQSYSGNSHMYIDNSNITDEPGNQQNYTARFTTNVNFTSVENCLIFFYYMYGCDTSDLKFIVERSNSDPETIFIKSGSQGNMWHKGVIPFTVDNNTQIYIEAVVQSNGREATIAIDEVSLYNATCAIDGGYSEWSEFSECSVPCNGGTHTRTRNCTTPSPAGAGLECQGPAIEQVSCNTEACLCTFEEDDAHCWLIQDLADDFDWRYYWRATPSRRTGPNGAMNGQRFAYIETSSPRQVADLARLKSSFTLPNTRKCFSMYYHMYGRDIGTLRVKMRTLGQSSFTTLFYRAGNKGNEWYYTAFEVPGGQALEISIEGVRAYGVYGDIALDDVKLLEGGCT